MSIIQQLFDSSKGIEFEISLKNEDTLPHYQLELVNNESFSFPIFGAKDDITGVVNIRVPGRSRLEHTGISIQLIGMIIDFSKDGTTFEFLQEEKELESAGSIMGRKSFKFSFKKVSKKYESYYGINVRVRYYLRVVASRPYRANLVEEKELWIIKKDKEPQGCRPIRMEVGVEDCLQIEFRFDKDTYCLTDAITGSIHFILARIHILHMDIEIIRKEIVGSGDKELIESEVVAKYEIMDGLPVKDEVIPVRMYLKPYDLSPSFKNVDKLFSLKYYINLVLVDSEERRFFKQQEITLWRASEQIE
ncbi:hypothetical protein WA538_002527 [Blastocystis sp. DL]